MFNRYGYVGNDPVNAIDPDGEFLAAIYGAIAGAVGGYVASGDSFQAKAAGVVAGALAGAVVGNFAPQTSRLVGMASAGMVASVAGQTVGSVSTAAMEKGVENVSMSDVKVDALTTVAAGVGTGAGAIVARGVAMSTTKPVVGSLLQGVTQPTNAGIAAGAVVEGAIIGASEKLANDYIENHEQDEIENE